MSAARFVAANPMLTRYLTADTADDALAQAAADLTARVAYDGHIALAGTEAAFMAERARLRPAVRAELEQAGRDVAAAEDQARQLSTVRAGLLARVIAWQDPADYDGGALRTAELAQRAGMTEHGLTQLRALLEDPEHPDRAGDERQWKGAALPGQRIAALWRGVYPPASAFTKTSCEARYRAPEDRRANRQPPRTSHASGNVT